MLGVPPSSQVVNQFETWGMEKLGVDQALNLLVLFRRAVAEKNPSSAFETSVREIKDALQLTEETVQLVVTKANELFASRIQHAPVQPQVYGRPDSRNWLGSHGLPRNGRIFENGKWLPPGT